MKIYIDNTKTNWVSIGTRDTSNRVEEMISGYTTNYRIVNSDNILHGSFVHYKDLTMEEKQSVVMESIKELNK